jgi:orotate phosphoribosyltransferase
MELKELKNRLSRLLKQEALKKGDFVLSSGKKSNYYLDGRVITLTPEGAYLVAKIILERVKAEGFTAVGGPTLGADPIVGALAVLAHQEQVALKTFIVRKHPKEHGMARRIEGPQLPKDAKVLLVDDVATTGKALIEAKEALEAAGIKAAKALVIVDRCEGAQENLNAQGISLEAIFTIRDFGL